MTEDITREFRLKEMDKIRNYFIHEIKKNELRSNKCKMVCKILNYIDHLLI